MYTVLEVIVHWIRSLTQTSLQFTLSRYPDKWIAILKGFGYVSMICTSWVYTVLRGCESGVVVIEAQCLSRFWLKQ